MKLLSLVCVFLLLVAALPQEYGGDFGWKLKGLKKCRQTGETCRRDYDCCGLRALCRVVPGDEGPFSMKFMCDDDGKRFYY